MRMLPIIPFEDNTVQLSSADMSIHGDPRCYNHIYYTDNKDCYIPIVLFIT